MLGNLRSAGRALTRNRTLTTISVLALALGSGLTTSMYSIVHGALRELPFEDSQRLIHLECNNPAQGIESRAVTLHDFLDWRSQQTSFEDLAAFYRGTVYLSGSQRPIRYDGAFVSVSTFRLLRVHASLGRTFVNGEDHPDAEPVLLISHEVWQNDFDGETEILGREVRINGEPGTIVGVMPERFRFPFDEEIWVPLRLNPNEINRGEDSTLLEVFGRLDDDVSMHGAGAQMTAIAQRLEQEYPKTNEGLGVLLKSYVEEYIFSEVRGLLYTMLGAVFLVLLVACANVANLMLSSAFERSKEVAVRTALGASRWRVISQMLTEALLLSAVGGLGGLGIGLLGVKLFNDAIEGAERPYWIDIRVDLSVLLFAAAVVLFCSLGAGVIPALQASGSNVGEVLKDESRGASSFRLGRLSRGLVVAEVALSCGLLVASGLAIKSVARLRNVDYGFPTLDVFTARIGLFEGGYPTVAQRQEFYRELRSRLQSQPEVLKAATMSALPGSGFAERWLVMLEGESYSRRPERRRTRVVAVSPNFFNIFDVELLRGRDVDARDDAGSQPVAVVNASFAARFFRGESPLGRRIRLGDEVSLQPWLTVVGVVPDLFIEGVENDEQSPDGLYVPLAQSDRSFISVAVRGQGDPLELATTVREVVAGLDPELPIYWPLTLQQVIDQTTWYYRVMGGLLVIFGLVALFLAGVGLYGVMSFSVRRRTQEMGVRMAMGARASDILRLVLRQGLWQIGFGLILGLVLAVLSSGLMEFILWDVESADMSVFATITVFVLTIGLSACLVPALRVARVEPVVALRLV